MIQQARNGQSDHGSPAIPETLLRLAEAVALIDVAYLADTQGRLLAASQGYRELMDLAVDATMVPPRHAGIVAAAVRDGESLGGTEMLGRGLGASAHAARHVPVRLPSGEIVGVLGVLIDAKEDPAGNRASRDRRRFQDFIRASADWVWETDRSGAISFVSDRVTEALGLPPILLLGRPFDEIGRSVSSDAQRVTIGAAMAARRPFRGAEIAIDDREGNERRFLVNAVAAFDDRGDFVGFRGTATDITPQRRAELLAGQAREELRAAHTELERKAAELAEALNRAHASERAKREFLATMSHELRTPLNAVIGFADILAQSEGRTPAPRVAEYAGDISMAARHLLRLIGDLLDVAAMDGATLRLQPVATEIGQLVAKARAMMLPQAAAGGVAVQMRVDPPDLAAHADPTRVLQVLINLLVSATKRTPAGGAVLIAAGVTADMVVIEVNDGGSALTPREGEQLFDAFGRPGSSVLTRPDLGLGLDLPIARGLARLMGGDLALHATGPAGSVFRLTLPRAQAVVAKP
ncbi:sensor histidine kinase [Desertibaculum subflavum]|uniref:sensor histidine kinase n=1 Tax=Desertibaculum subflavum TaxID=2268458 RepID=UPI000E66816E